MALTPMMQQYMAVKEQYRDCILFYRLGDFYEMFFDDALTASRDMDVALTQRACGEGEKAPMCGVPFHAADTYIARLIEKGHKVAICEQMTDPALSKGLVERSVIRIVTPGTLLSDAMLPDRDNNFLACIFEGEGFGLSWCDISTGEFYASRIRGESSLQQLLAQLIKIRPREILLNVGEDEDPSLYEQFRLLDEPCLTNDRMHLFADDRCRDRIAEHFGVPNPKAVGLDAGDEPLLYHACGALLGYLKETQMQDLSHLSRLEIRNAAQTMSLDRASIKNLELTETLFERKVKGSLFGVLDCCGTAMGSRRMKNWLCEPLNELSAIRARLDAVEVLADDVLLRNDLRTALKGIYDLERLCARIACHSANARDLVALRSSLALLPDIREALTDSKSALLAELASQIASFEDLTDRLDRAIVDDPPFTLREGGMIRSGYSDELDGIAASVEDKQAWIAALEGQEKDRTGIRTLRVGYNRVFGYYIEVSNSFKDKVPPEYIRKQTLANGERFITPELKEAESVVLNAQTRTNELEYRLFTELRDAVEARIPDLQKTASALASLDVLAAFAECAVRYDYVKPSMTDGDRIVIKKGRHPVIEQSMQGGLFVSNDVYMDRKDASMLLITGPNMSGKSTYMRQLALIVLMAQAGCFVPAQSAEIGLCDRIYTRIGASDNLAMGQSTFFVEMSELAYILNTATERSLVILDEIGRGTSTYDGLSIAWAVVEALTAPGRRVRTLFATHYHELTALEGSIPGVRNLNVDVAEQNGNIVFLHRIVEGSASRSYGIHVAKLAGVPEAVLENAQKKLDLLVAGAVQPAMTEAAPEETQMTLFRPQDSVLAEKLRGLDLMNLTASQALALLEELKRFAEEE